MGPSGCPETSVRNHHYTLRNIPAEGVTRALGANPLEKDRPVAEETSRKTRNITTRRIYVPQAGFEPTIPTNKRPYTYAV